MVYSFCEHKQSICILKWKAHVEKSGPKLKTRDHQDTWGIKTSLFDDLMIWFRQRACRPAFASAHPLQLNTILMDSWYVLKAKRSPAAQGRLEETFLGRASWVRRSPRSSTTSESCRACTLWAPDGAFILPCHPLSRTRAAWFSVPASSLATLSVYSTTCFALAIYKNTLLWNSRSAIKWQYVLCAMSGRTRVGIILCTIVFHETDIYLWTRIPSRVSLTWPNVDCLLSSALALSSRPYEPFATIFFG